MARAASPRPGQNKGATPPAAAKPRAEAHDQETGEVIEGEIVESTERAMVRVNQIAGGNDLDAGLAVALSEAEINQQIVTARRFPRSLTRATENIMTLAGDTLQSATECLYSLPRGRDDDGRAKAITGPSIRFAEIVAQQWGNCRVAARTIAVDRKEKFVEAEGIYHDLETNYAVARRVRRRISDKYGKLYSDDMITVTGNAAAAIALRNAILSGVPKAVWGRGFDKVVRTISGDEKSLAARRVALLQAFNDQMGIKPETVYKMLGVAGELDVGLSELVVAQGFYSALRNNEVTPEDLIAQVAQPLSTNNADGRGLTTQSAFGGIKAGGDGAVAGYGGAGGAPQPQAGPGGAAQPTSGGNGTGGAKETPQEPKQPEATDTPAEPETPAGDEKSGVPDAESDQQSDVADRAATADEDGNPAYEVRDADPDHPDFVTFGEKVDAAESWLQVKAAYTGLRRSVGFLEQVEPDKEGNGGDPDFEDELRSYALEKMVALKEAGDPVDWRADPIAFDLWLTRGPSEDDATDVFRDLIRTDAYRKLSDAEKDRIGILYQRTAGTEE